MASVVLTKILLKRYATVLHDVRVDMEATKMHVNIADRGQRRNGLASSLVRVGTFVKFCLWVHCDGKRKDRKENQ